MKFKNNKSNKKANTTFVFSIVIISIISFFMIINFFSSSSDFLSSQVSDLACKSLLETKSSDFGKVADFLFGVNLKCKIDSITIKSEKKEEIFSKIADSSYRCWKRYGSGELDFLSSFQSSGNWCFECAEVNFKNQNKNYKYNDFISYLNQNKNKQFEDDIKKQNEFSDIKPSYLNSFSIKSIDSNYKENIEIKKKLLNLMNSNDLNLRETALILGEQYLYNQNLRSKEINTNNNLHLVYRVDRVDNIDFSKRLESASTGALYGVGGSILVGAIAENALWWGGSILACGSATVTFGLLSPLCAGSLALSSAKTAASTVSASKKVITTTADLKKVLDISNKLTSSIKISGRSKNFMRLEDLEEISGTRTGLNLLSQTLKTNKKEEFIPLIEDITLSFNKLKIDEISQINPLLIRTIEDRKKLIELVNLAINNNLISNLGIKILADKEVFYSKKIKELGNLQKKIKNYDLLTDNLDDGKKLLDIRNLISTSVILVSGVSGAIIGYNLDLNSNQYISLMNDDEFYRSCGTFQINK